MNDTEGCLTARTRSSCWPAQVDCHLYVLQNDSKLTTDFYWPARTDISMRDTGWHSCSCVCGLTFSFHSTASFFSLFTFRARLKPILFLGLRPLFVSNCRTLIQPFTLKSSTRQKSFTICNALRGKSLQEGSWLLWQILAIWSAESLIAFWNWVSGNLASRVQAGGRRCFLLQLLLWDRRCLNACSFQADLFFVLKTEQFSLTSWFRDFVSWRSRSFATVSVTDATIFAIPDKKSWMAILFYSQEASTYHRHQDWSPPGHQLCPLLFARCSSFLLRGFGSWQIECAHGKQTLTCVTF